MKKQFDQVYQFKITLQKISPLIWRRIQGPASYTFWDLLCLNISMISGITGIMKSNSKRYCPAKHESMLEWAGGEFHPEHFDCSEVVFDDPAERLKNMEEDF